MPKPITLRSTTFNSWRANTNTISKSVGDVDLKIQNDSVAEATIGNLAQHANVTLTPTLTSGATTATISTVGIQIRPGMDVLSTAFVDGTSVSSVDYATGVITFSNQANASGAISVTFSKSTTSVLNDIELRKIDKSGDIVTGDFGVLGNVTLGNNAADDHVITGQVAINQSITGTEVIQVTGDSKFTGNVAVTDNLSVDGNTTLGNAAGDTVTLNAKALSTPNSLAVNTDLLYIDAATNRIGINAATPYASLTVKTKSTDIGNDARGIVVEQNDNTTAFSQAKFIGSRSRGTTGSPAAVQLNDSLVSFNGRGYKATTWSNTVGGLYIYAAENWTDTSTGTYITLRGAAVGTTAVSEWMRLTSSTVTINATTASSSPTTGALVVGGGLGVGGAINVTGVATFNGDVVMNADTYLGNTVGDSVYQNGTLKLAATSKLQVGASGDVAASVLMTDATAGAPVLRSFTSTDNTVVITLNTSTNGVGTIDVRTSGVMPVAAAFNDNVTLGDSDTDRVIMNSYIDGPSHMGTLAAGGAFIDTYPMYSSSTSTGSVNVGFLSNSTYRTVEYLIQAVNGTKYYCTKVIAIHDGTNLSMSEYGTIKLGAWGTMDFNVNISGPNIALSYSNAPTGTTVVKVLATAFK